MVKKKRVGLKEAKKIFHKRSIRSQVRDRATTSKQLVYPYTKNSYKWKQNPNRYDMALVDTKSNVQRSVIEGELYAPYGKAPNVKQAKRMKKETLAGFSKRISIPKNLKIGELEQESSVKVRYKKKGKGYTIYIRPKTGKTSIVHPIVMQKGGR